MQYKITITVSHVASAHVMSSNQLFAQIFHINTDKLCINY